MRRWANAILGALIVTASAYTPMTQHQSGIAADGSQVKPGITAAVSHNLRYLIGRYIYIEGIGKRRVNDLMNRRFSNFIDICVDSKGEARMFGVKRNIKIKFEGK